MTESRSGGGNDPSRRWDAVFGALSAEPRRWTVASLLDAPPGAELSLPAAARPPEAAVDGRPPDGAAERLRVELVHVHLPKLADPGFVEWGRDPLRVARGPRFEEVAVVVASLDDSADAVPGSLACLRMEGERTGA
jgi:hypothetical protein